MHFLLLLFLGFLFFYFIRSFKKNFRKKSIDIFHTVSNDPNFCLKVYVTNSRLGLNNVKIFETNERSNDEQALQALKRLDADLQSLSKFSEVVNFGYKLTIDRI
jgi:hypothetical protein